MPTDVSLNHGGVSGIAGSTVGLAGERPLSPVERLTQAFERASRLADEMDVLTVRLVGHVPGSEQADPNVSEVIPSAEFERVNYFARELERLNARFSENMERINSAMSQDFGRAKGQIERG